MRDNAEELLGKDPPLEPLRPFRSRRHTQPSVVARLTVDVGKGRTRKTETDRMIGTPNANPLGHQTRELCGCVWKKSRNADRRNLSV